MVMVIRWWRRSWKSGEKICGAIPTAEIRTNLLFWVVISWNWWATKNFSEVGFLKIVRSTYDTSMTLNYEVI